MSSGFVSENALEEARQKRQEEWEKVRKPDQPKEAPEEEYDHRSLFERLEANRKTKQAEWDAEHDIKKVARGIDDDEADFLSKVDDIKSKFDLERRQEEKSELENYRKMKEKLLEEKEEESKKFLKSEQIVSTRTKSGSSTKKAQKSLLGAVVKVKKRPIENAKVEPNSETKKQKPNESAALSGLLGDYGSSSEDEEDLTK